MNTNVAVLNKKNCGFDLTFFKDKGFNKVLKLLNISEEAKRDKDNNFVWSNELITIVTCNNPITGEYYNIKRRDNQANYASSIGITGESNQVKKAVRLIKSNAEYIKGYDSKCRSFV